MTKALSGEELVLDDGPAHGRDLFLVDGNNLAYRAYFALPEELATSEGQPTNALLGFANMLFKLLVDYKPKAALVAWDTKPTSRLDATGGTAAEQALAARYKSERKPMPSLLGAQFPYFAPIVEAFGYRNLRFEGWEADDVIATLATEADAAGLAACVVSTDRDAFQLVTERVCLMMTPRGVSDVQVYTPERVRARYGIEPAQIPDFIGLKGDSSDNIPGVPGVGEKTAAEMLVRFGSLEAILARASELPKARGRSVIEHADQARAAKAMATSRRDLPLGIDLASLVTQAPDRSRMREMFRRFEFKSLLKRVDVLDQALPSRGPEAAGEAVAFRRGALEAKPGERVALVVREGRFALARDREVVVGTLREGEPIDLGGALLVAHDAKSLPPNNATLVDDTILAAYLVEPSRPSYLVEDMLAEQGLEVLVDPSADVHTAALVRAAEGTRRLALRYRERIAERGQKDLYEQIELPLVEVLSSMQRAGVRVDLEKLYAITREVAEKERSLEAQAQGLAGERFALGSPKQVGHLLFERLGLSKGRKTKTGYSTDITVLRALKDEHPIVPVLIEWREISTLLHGYLETLPGFVRGSDGRIHTTFHQTVAATGRLSTSDPNLQSIPVKTELGRRLREVFVAAEGNVLVGADYGQIELRVLAHLSGEPALLDAFERGVDVHARTAAEVFQKPVEAVTEGERSMAKRVGFGILYGISAFGLSEDLDIERADAKAMIETYLARLPRVRELLAKITDEARRDGFVTTLFGRRRPVPEIRATQARTRALGERLAVNSVVQGTAADIIKIAMVRLHRELAGDPGARMILQIHDELLFEVEAGRADAVGEVVRRAMEGVLAGPPKLAVDVGAGPSWGATKRKLG